jgi:hypothetical protein
MRQLLDQPTRFDAFHGRRIQLVHIRRYDLSLNGHTLSVD